MKKIIMLLICTLLLTPTVFSYENACENYENMIITGGNYSVVADPNNEFEKVLKLESNEKVNLKIPLFDKLPSGNFEFSYRIRFGNNGNNVIFLPTIAANGVNVIDPQLHKNVMAVSDGSEWYHKGTYMDDVWYNIMISFDTEALTYSISIDSQNIPEKNSILKIANVVVHDIDSIEMSVSKGYVMLDDINLKRVGDGGERTILFSSSYNENHISKTISILPFNMKKSDFLNTILLKKNVNIMFSSKKTYISDGDTISLLDLGNNTTQEYTLNVRTPNISKKSATLFKRMLILKENSDIYYVNGLTMNNVSYKNGLISKEALNHFGINVDTDKRLAELEHMGLYTKTFDDGYSIVSKMPFSKNAIFYKACVYDLGKLFLGR